MWYFALTGVLVSIVVIVQFAALAVTVAIGVCVVYTIFEMREVYADQREKFLRAISAVEKFHKLQPELTSLVRSVESDGHALQKIAMQIEVAVAALENTIAASVSGTADRQTAVIDELRDHIDSQGQRLLKILESVSDGLHAFPQPQPAVLAPPPAVPEPKSENSDYLRLRKEVVTRDPQIRFSVLKEWISTNALALLHRASRGWNTSNELIANIPPYLEAEAEVAGGCVLVIGTRAYAEKLAIPIGDLDPSSDLTQWFEVSSNGNGNRHIPAVLMRSNGHFELISKGSAYEVLSRRTGV